MIVLHIGLLCVRQYTGMAIVQEKYEWNSNVFPR